MPRDALQKHTLNLRAGDMQRLAELHPDLQPSLVIRQLVSQHVDRKTKEVLENVEVE